MTVKDGGPAFPRELPAGLFPLDDALKIIREHAGMSLRQWFAGKAMQVLIDSDTSGRQDPWWAAKKAYEYADAMLKEGEK